MAQLVLLVVAAAWAAVLIPPMLRSRVENRPNSSVTDFRRQLSKLQSSATPPRGTVRAMGRPLAPSNVHRPAATRGRAPVHHRHSSYRSSAVRGHAPTPYRAAQGGRVRHDRDVLTRDSGGYRVHGDPSGSMHRPGPAAIGPADPRGAVKQRRTNVLVLLVAVTACTLFLATTTQSTVMLYVFALAFLALCGYVYLLAQLRQREHAGWNDAWFD
jgi:hypothetical protein